MKISSPAFAESESIPQKYSCDGDKINPPLSFSGMPENTKSLALIVDDPDAPAGTFTHWTVWNIKPDTMGIAENSVPEGVVQGATSRGNPGYVSPCPPTGTHRYFFKLYALDTEISLGSKAEVNELIQAMKGHVIEKAELLGKYGR